MTNVNVIIRRYATAFAEYVKPGMGISGALDELGGLKEIIEKNGDFFEFLTDPEISETEKVEFIDKTLSLHLSSEVVNFIKFLIKKGRIGFIKEIINYFILTYAREGETRAVVKTARMVNPDILKKIAEILENKYGSKFFMENKLDPGLLGGAEIEIHNFVIDGSLKSRIKELGEKLLSAGV